MFRKLLIAILIPTLIIELVLTGSVFFATATTMQKFGVTLTSDTSFLAFIIGWTLLFISIICFMALQQGIKNKNYHTLCYVLGWGSALAFISCLKNQIIYF